jgi:microcystin-dependent protein
MSDPTVYARQYNFRNYQTANPTDPLPGDELDIELNEVKDVTDSLNDAIVSLRRSDGSLQNAIVTADSLDESALALIGAGNWTARGIWTTATAYVVGDVVRNTVTGVTTTYVCSTAHTSGTFATDYSAGDWVDLTSARSADLISYDNAISGLTADDVKAALDEIDAKVDLITLPGEIRPYAGLTAPSGWLLCYGQAVSRTTYATLFAAIAVSQSGVRTNGSAIITALTDTTGLVTGMFVSGTGIPAAATILTVDSSTQITLSANATSSGTATVVIGPFGIGDGSTTFNVPDLRGRALIGRDDMGGSAASRVTSGTSGIAATRVGATGGLQTLMAHTHTVDTKGTGTAGTTAAVMKANAAADGTITSNSTGTGASHGNMQPSAVINFIVKT